jgi:hypothetical protein
VADGAAIPLGAVRQAGGKTVIAFAVEGEFDPARLASNTFTLEWPPHSGRMQEFPEADRAAWFALDAARAKILKGQAPLLERWIEGGRLEAPIPIPMPIPSHVRRDRGAYASASGFAVGGARGARSRSPWSLRPV